MIKEENRDDKEGTDLTFDVLWWQQFADAPVEKVTEFSSKTHELQLFQGLYQAY